MRNAFFFLIVTFAGSAFFVAGASAAAVESSHSFTGPGGNDFGILSDEDRRLLPINANALPLSGATDGNGVARETPQVSVVEAIPTPTAFHAGATLLAAILVGRFYRKLRTQFTAAG